MYGHGSPAPCLKRPQVIGRALSSDVMISVMNATMFGSFRSSILALKRLWSFRIVMDFPLFLVWSGQRFRHLDKVVGVRSGPTQGAMLVGADRIHRGAAAVEARPIADIGQHQPRYQILAQLGQPFERTAIIEDAHEASAPDVTLVRVLGMEQHLLVALPSALAL